MVDQDIARLELGDSSSNLSNSELGSLRSLYSLHSAILRQLSIKWQSKVRMNWLLFGDSNSSFFHEVTSIGSKRRRSSLDGDAVDRRNYWFHGI